MNHLRIVFPIFKDHQFYPKFSKYECWHKWVSLLGHIVPSMSMEVDPKKTKMVKVWPRPLTPIDIRCFLGLIGYYRRIFRIFPSFFAIDVLNSK